MAAYAFAQGLRTIDTLQHRVYGTLKTQLLGGQHGTVVEIGPGTGLNLAYLNRDITYIGLEPNPHLHADIYAQMRVHGISGRVIEQPVEANTLPAQHADAVISTLVLCSVPCVRTALNAIQRLLKPGGRFVFIEHIAAPRSSYTCSLQNAVTPLWHRCFDGCHPNRHIDRAITEAGFNTVKQHTMTLSIPIISPHCYGYACC